MRLRFPVTAAALFAAGLVSGPTDAEACGGCFVPPADNTIVTGHRMAMSVSPTQTVLWDQFEYAGDPSDFAWVLPIKQGAWIELSSDAWFEALEAGTVVNVVAPPINCGGSSGGFGCGASQDAGAFAEGTNNNGVTVVHEGTVGPYETVTLRATEPGALNTWLAEHNYAVDPAFQPTIDAYVAEGFDFIALKLIPGNDVSLMKPVRVVSPGASPTLPLRMVAAGTGAQVPIVLYVISEGRYAAKSFPNAMVPLELLSWDYAVNDSNYAELRERTLQQGEGKSWITAYAQRGALLSPVTNPYFFGTTQYNTSFGFVDTLGDAYFAQAYDNGETDEQCAEASTYADSLSVVVDPCPPPLPDQQDYVPFASSCGITNSGIDARKLTCGQSAIADDIARALVGLHPADVWITRMEANLPHGALATDLVIEPAATQLPRHNWIQAKITEHQDQLCGSAMPVLVSPDDADAGRRTGALLGLGLAAFVVLGLGARRVRLGARAR
jgi:hypothetical protein